MNVSPLLTFNVGDFVASDSSRIYHKMLTFRRWPVATRCRSFRDVFRSFSGETDLHRAEPRQIHCHAVARLEPHGLDQASGQHDLAGAQGLAAGGEMVGQPRQRVMRMTE